MVGIVNFIFIVTFIVEFITGNLLNGFIAGVNIKDWVKRRKISVVDQIVTALAISRFALMWLVIPSFLVTLVNSAKVTGNIIKMINISWVVANHFNLWLSTNLSLFYFFKIVSFSNSIFLYLKRRVTKVVSVTLILSLVLLFSHVAVINTLIDVLIDGNRGNLSHNSSWMNSARFFRYVLLTNSLFALIPFTVSLIAFLLLIFSLWKHHKQMQNSAAGYRDASTSAHIKALKTVITFLFLYTAFLLYLFINIWSIDFMERFLVYLLSMAAGNAFPSLHSCALILGSPKLRRATSVLWSLSCKGKGEESSGL